MKTVMKFKDGTTYTQEQSFASMTGKNNFLEMFMNSKKNNAGITMRDSNTGEITETNHSQVVSLEIIFDE